MSNEVSDSVKISLLDKDVKRLNTEFEKDRLVNEKHWQNFYDFKEELLSTLNSVRKPSSFKDIIIAISSTLVVVSLLVGGFISIVDSRIAVPVQQQKELDKKFELYAYKQNEIIGISALQNAKLSTIIEKVNANTEFVNEYIYSEKIPSVLTSMKKDIEYLQINSRRTE